MEDISRELEREIARIKPAPHKMRKNNTILILNDFGEMRSGDFLKILVCFFLVISMAGGFCSIAFYRLYFNAKNQNIQLKSSQGVLEKKVDRLTSEKELLMARLVMTGNAAELETLTRAGKVGPPPQKEKRSGMKEKKDSIESSSIDTTPDSENAKDERVGLDDKNSAPSQAQAGEGADGPAGQSHDRLPPVSVESFSLSPGSNGQAVVIRFNIKNTTQNSTEISGRIFCVLRSKGATPDKWVVIPKASMMEDGVPGPYNQGHYFSISRFKPVRFTITTPKSLPDFADASVFIFDEKEKLLSKTTFEIGKNKPD